MHSVLLPTYDACEDPDLLVCHDCSTICHLHLSHMYMLPSSTAVHTSTCQQRGLDSLTTFDLVTCKEVKAKEFNKENRDYRPTTIASGELTTAADATCCGLS